MLTLVRQRAQLLSTFFALSQFYLFLIFWPLKLYIYYLNFMANNNSPGIAIWWYCQHFIVLETATCFTCFFFLKTYAVECHPIM